MFGRMWDVCIVCYYDLGYNAACQERGVGSLVKIAI